MSCLAWGKFVTVNKKTVVIADDSATTVMLLSLLVERMGFKVISAKNGLEVLKLMHQNPPDGVLLDLRMPVMDGRTALRHIRQDPRLASVPVVVVTVESGAQARYDCLRLGCTEFISKPVRLSDLHYALQACFKDRSKVRKHLRAPFNRPVRAWIDGTAMDFFAVNLSERGIFLRCSEPLPEGTEVVVSLVDAEGGEHACTGAVVRHQPGWSPNGTSNEVGMAVEFTRMDSRAAVALKHLVHRLLVSDLSGEGSTEFLLADVSEDKETEAEHSTAPRTNAS